MTFYDDIKGAEAENIRLMTEEELENEGWHKNSRVVVIEFSSGSKLYASMDEEGNGPGSLFGTNDNGKSMWLNPGAVNEE